MVAGMDQECGPTQKEAFTSHCISRITHRFSANLSYNDGMKALKDFFMSEIRDDMLIWLDQSLSSYISKTALEIDIMIKVELITVDSIKFGFVSRKKIDPSFSNDVMDRSFEINKTTLGTDQGLFDLEKRIDSTIDYLKTAFSGGER